MSDLDQVMRDDGWLTVAVAARLVCVHGATIRRLAEAGDLRSTLVGKRRYVSLRSLGTYYAGAPPIVKRLEQFEKGKLCI